jgi:hypothetical protein
MARGFESKDVEFQQAEAERRTAPGRAMTDAERAEAARRRSIELALARSRRELANATAPAHRHMLELAIADLESQLGIDA